jgi:hypothetical protein
MIAIDTCAVRCVTAAQQFGCDGGEVAGVEVFGGVDHVGGIDPVECWGADDEPGGGVLVGHDGVPPAVWWAAHPAGGSG